MFDHWIHLNHLFQGLLFESRDSNSPRKWCSLNPMLFWMAFLHISIIPSGWNTSDIPTHSKNGVAPQPASVMIPVGIVISRSPVHRRNAEARFVVILLSKIMLLKFDNWWSIPEWLNIWAKTVLAPSGNINVSISCNEEMEKQWPSPFERSDWTM